MVTIESMDLRKSLIPIRCLADEKLAVAEFRIEFCKKSVKISYINQSHTGYGKYELKTGPISKSLQNKVIEMTYGQILPILRMNKSVTFKKEGKDLFITAESSTLKLESVVEPFGKEIKFPFTPTVVKTTARELKPFNLKGLNEFGTCQVNLNNNPTLSCGEKKSDNFISLKLPKKEGKNVKADFDPTLIKKIIRAVPTKADVELGLLGNNKPLRLKIYEGQGAIYLAPRIERG